MKNELNSTNNELATEKITIRSLEKLDNNYVHIIGESEFLKINVITNGIFTLDFSSFSEIKEFFNYNEVDYLIAKNFFGEYFLISLNDGKRLVKKAKYINYISDGLFTVSNKDIASSEKVYDAIANNYIPFPQNMIYKSYKDGVFVLQENDEESSKKRKEMVIDRSGNTIIPINDGYITIINHDRYIKDNMIIDFNQNVIIKDTDLILPFTNERILILKNRKLFILNSNFEVIKTYMIGQTKKPWYFAVHSEECITITFKKKIRTKKHNPRIEKDVTVIVNTITDTISEFDFMPSLSVYDIFTVTNSNHLKGLMNKMGETILEAKWDNIKALHDSDNKYFFIEKNDEHYIFNSDVKAKLEVPYTEMKEFRDGLAIGYSEDDAYQLIDENLKPVFNLEHMGNMAIYYKNGILCYHSGNYRNDYDAYTIITKSGETLMNSRECQVKRNSFGLLEINDKETGKNIFFNMDNGQFLQLEINIPKNSDILDFNGLSIQQYLTDNKSLKENNENVKRLVLKPSNKTT